MHVSRLPADRASPRFVLVPVPRPWACDDFADRIPHVFLLNKLDYCMENDWQERVALRTDSQADSSTTSDECCLDMSLGTLIPIHIRDLIKVKFKV